MTEPTSFLVGLIGAGIQASLTPPMHEREGARHGFRYVYRKLDLDVLGVGADALPTLLDEAEREGFNGLNITYPCKQAVLACLHELSDDARAIGAVNTVVFKGGRRVGHNTDCSGFAESFRAGLAGAPRGQVVLLGAGGAGAAVAHALLGEGVGTLVLVDPDHAKARPLAEALCVRFGAGRCRVSSDLAADLATADGLVHATPTGMAKHPGLPLPATLLRPTLWVADIVYFPIETELLRAANALGCRTLSGGGMAVYQAVGAFRLFTGVEPDARAMRADFDELVRRPRS
jgi:shikimate dehydrogenase